MKRSRAKPDPWPRFLHFRRRRPANKLQKRNDFSHGLLFRQSPNVAGLPRTSQHRKMAKSLAPAAIFAVLGTLGCGAEE
jgi:hypothetical protein